MTIWIDTNGRPSNSANVLSKLPGFKRNITGKFVKPSDLVVNWGSTQPNNTTSKGCLNIPVNVLFAANKHSSFAEMSLLKVPTVDWTTEIGIAQKWSDNDQVVVVRNKLTGHSGDGIIILEKGQEVPKAPLYTRYVFKVKEFRVHVANNSVIDVQKKVRDPDREPTTWKVRSYDNGFIYVRNTVEQSETRDNIAVAAVSALGLDFGAVDIIEDKNGNFYVLEVNTAPGLEGQTLDNYAKAFSSWTL